MTHLNGKPECDAHVGSYYSDGVSLDGSYSKSPVTAARIGEDLIRDSEAARSATPCPQMDAES